MITRVCLPYTTVNDDDGVSGSTEITLLGETEEVAIINAHAEHNGYYMATVSVIVDAVIIPILGI